MPLPQPTALARVTGKLREEFLQLRDTRTPPSPSDRGTLIHTPRATIPSNAVILETAFCHSTRSQNMLHCTLARSHHLAAHTPPFHPSKFHATRRRRLNPCGSIVLLNLQANPGRCSFLLCISWRIPRLGDQTTDDRPLGQRDSSSTSDWRICFVQ